MSKLLSLILTGLISSLITKIVVGLGLSVVTYHFINDLVIQAQNEIGTSLYSLPAFALAFISIAKIDQAISVIVSALSITAFIKSAKIFLGKA